MPLEGWIRQLAALVLMAGVAELLLPSGALRAYARSVLGLLILLGLLRPVVALAHGEISLQLPSAPVAAIAQETSQAQQAAAQVYLGLLQGQVVRMAEQIPGVEAAAASVTLGPDGQTPTSATVQVAPSPSGLAMGTDLDARVQAAVAQGLGLKGDQVSVREW